MFKAWWVVRVVRWFEVMDQGSQFIARACEAAPGDTVRGNLFPMQTIRLWLLIFFIICDLLIRCDPAPSRYLMCALEMEERR